MAEFDEMMRSLQERTTVLEQENILLRSRQLRSQASEARYRQVFENAPIHMCFYAADGRMTQVNRAFEQATGVTLEAILEINWNLFEDPQLIENGTLPYMQQAFAGKAVIEPPSYYNADRTVLGAKLSYGRGHYFSIRNEQGEIEEIGEICSAEGIYRFEYHPPVSLPLPVDEQAGLIHQSCYFAEGNQTYVQMCGLESREEFDGA